jgi:hypothetical protein
MCIKYIYIYKKFTIVLGLESRVVTLLISCLRSMKQIYKFNESLFIWID